MKSRILSLLVFTSILCCLLPVSARSQSGQTGDSETPVKEFVLVQALLCEDIQENTPKNPTTVFSIARQKAFCYTSFDPVNQQAFIYHRWYRRERPSARIKLSLRPPRWSTYSSIQFRAEDIGPWRVEIADEQGRILQVLRFSITE